MTGENVICRPLDLDFWGVEDVDMGAYSAQIKVLAEEGKPIPLYQKLVDAGVTKRTDRFGNPVVMGLDIIRQRSEGYYPVEYVDLRNLGLVEIGHECDMSEAYLTETGERVVQILEDNGFEFQSDNND